MEETPARADDKPWKSNEERKRAMGKRMARKKSPTRREGMGLPLGLVSGGRGGAAVGG